MATKKKETKKETKTEVIKTNFPEPVQEVVEIIDSDKTIPVYVFPEVKLTSGRRLVIIDSSVDEVARLEADRKELQKPLCGIF